nr:hypothetical protein LKV13_04450 [Borrelia sp. BU AG58]
MGVLVKESTESEAVVKEKVRKPYSSMTDEEQAINYYVLEEKFNHLYQTMVSNANLPIQ